MATMEEQLKYILASTNDWLKFAEAKNAALITFTGGAILALLALLPNMTNAVFLYFLTRWTIPWFFLALLFSLNSLLSITSKVFFTKPNRPGPNDHIFYFGDIIKYGSTDYLNKVYTLHGQALPQTHNLIEDEIACQLIINAKIASRKFRLFNIALRITLYTVVSTLLFIFLPYFSMWALNFYNNVLGITIK